MEVDFVEECSAVGTFRCCSGGFQPAVNESRDNQRTVGSTHLWSIPTGFVFSRATCPREQRCDGKVLASCLRPDCPGEWGGTAPPMTQKLRREEKIVVLSLESSGIGYPCTRLRTLFPVKPRPSWFPRENAFPTPRRC